MKYLLIKPTDPDIRTKKLRYPDPDPVLTDPTFYYPDPDSAPPDIRIFGSDPDRISDRIRISDKSPRPTWKHRENETKTIEYQHLNGVYSIK